jgi:ATPase family associated with various cellular activities (AAA)/AAA+ lid domain
MSTAAFGASRSPSPAAAVESSSVHELRTLILSRHPAIAIETSEEERLDTLLAAVAADTRLTIFDWSITRGLVREPGVQPVYGTSDPARVLAAVGELAVDGLFVLKDFGAHLADAATSRALRELLERFAAPAQRSTIVLVSATLNLPAEVEAQVVRYELRLPGREEYRAAIETVVESLRLNGSAQVAIAAADYDAFAAALSGLTLNQARQAVAQVAIDDGRLTAEDLGRVVDIKARAIRDDGPLEYFPALENTFQLGGFANLRRWLQRAHVAFGAEAAALNLPAHKGVMLVGVQGCGKSLAAKVIAREWQLPLLKLDAGRLYDKYVGESEKHLRRALASAESMAPVVLWIDEIEKGMAPSGGADADGGLSRRLFGSFLTWLQEKRADVFVVATANDLSALPPELLRKGRFDEIFFVDLPDASEREAILRIHLALRKQDPEHLDLARIVAAADGFSGAELEQVVIVAVLRALQEHRPLDTQLLLDELAATVPLSVSRREDVERLRALARERFVPVR